jgi:hypothetical protein
MACLAITLGRVNYQALVSDQFVRGCVVPAVADYASDTAVDIFDKFSIVHEDLLPYLQRR